MKNIKSIKIAIMELFQKANNGEIKQEVAEYFIDKLDTIGYETNQYVKRSGLYSNNLSFYKNLEDILPYLAPKIYFEQERAKNEIILLQLNEDKFGENARKVFFMKQRDGSYIYLGSLIDLDKDINNEVYININKANISPYTYEQLADDKNLFNKLNEIYLEKYKNFIDKNIKCICAMLKNNENDNEKFNSYLKTWQKSLEKEGLSYRFDIYKKLLDKQK